MNEEVKGQASEVVKFRLDFMIESLLVTYTGGLGG